MKKLFSLFFALFMLVLFSMMVTASEGPTEKDKAGADAVLKQIKWQSYDKGMVQAKTEGKHVIINFTTSWCGYCKKMNQTTFKVDEIVKLIGDNFVAIKVDGDSKKELNVGGYKITEQNITRNEYGVASYPTYWFVKPDGEKLGQIKGYQNADPFAEILFFTKERVYDKMTFDEFMKAGGRKNYKG